MGIVRSSKDTLSVPVSEIRKVAPHAEITVIDRIDSVFTGTSGRRYDIILFPGPFLPGEYKMLEKITGESIKKGTIPVFPAYTGPMEPDRDYTCRRDLIGRLSGMGAIIVGTHGSTFQLGNLEFWKTVPVDLFALNAAVMEDRYWSAQSFIPHDLRSASFTAAGCFALLKGIEPDLNAVTLKKRIAERCRKIIWAVSDVKYSRDYRATPFLSREKVEELRGSLESRGHRILETYPGYVLDAAQLTGISAPGNGEWNFKMLRISRARKAASGKNVVVAILDHQFKDYDPALDRRIVKPGSVIEGKPVFDPETRLGHGTWMARELVRIAPDVQIMPVRIRDVSQGRDAYPLNLIAGIDYAVRNGARIISISHGAVPEAWYPELDRALTDAVNAGVMVVFIHYYGDIQEILVPHPIEYAGFDHPRFRGKTFLFIVGTGYFNETSFPHTWGFSQCAPIVSGVVALLMERDPDLKPGEIIRILKETGMRIEGKYPLIDAFRAIQHMDGGR
jgi:hypothetical protein